jgi:hypothetical protein
MNKVWDEIMEGPILKRQGDKDEGLSGLSGLPSIPPSPRSTHSVELPRIEEKTK